tara:strand:- start:189 stop:1253 length:1065 start_codon:yes stop_codon:yes gene_type:complete
MTKAAELAKMGEVLTNSQIGGRRNIIINGAMQVAQRGTSIAVSSTAVYTLDRFSAHKDTNTMTATQASDAPTGFEYSLKLTNGTGASPSSSDINCITYSVEGYDSTQLEIGTTNAKKVTLSFHVKSSITGTYVVGFLDSGNDNGYIADYTINSANTWEKKTITLTMSDYGSWVGSSTNGTNLILHWDLNSGSDRDVSSVNVWNDGASNDFSHSSQVDWVGTTGSTFYLTGVQLEVGSQATPFEHRSFGEELGLCQRYFELLNGGIAMGASDSATTTQASVQYKQSKRAGATIAKSGTVYANDGATQGTVSGVANSKDFTGGVLITFTTSSISNNEVIFIYANNEADGITADAEL